MKTLKIKKISKIEDSSSRYDIQTKYTSNFFANGILVHNSLITLYFYMNEWHVSTSGTPDANTHVNSFNSTFAELFWSVWKSLGYSMPTCTHYCYMFELMTPLNRVVVQHSKNRIVLHGVRDMLTLQEYSPESFAYNGWECVRSFPLGTIEDILSAANNLNPMETEGYVVRDGNFNRIKVKSPQYVAIHHIKDSMSARRMLEIVRTNEGSEFLNYFPEMEPLYKEIKSRYDKLTVDISAVYEQHKGEVTQKDFALKVKDLSYSFACFSLRANKGTVRDILADINIKHLESLLNLDDIDASTLFVETA